MKTVIIVQARMSSSRFPGKILKKVRGKPLLEYQYERLIRVSNAHEVVIATTENPNDEPIVNLCKKKSIACFRGSEEDVLCRYYETAQKYCAECVVRVNSDCPLIDPQVVSHVIDIFLKRYPKYDYVANILERSYPIGLHTEVFSFQALESAYTEAIEKPEREHVTPFIYRNPERFKLYSVTHPEDLSKFRWTLDYPEDFELISNVFKSLYDGNPFFNMNDIIRLLRKRPEWCNLNSHFEKQQTV